MCAVVFKVPEETFFAPMADFADSMSGAKVLFRIFVDCFSGWYIRCVQMATLGGREHLPDSIVPRRKFLQNPSFVQNPNLGNFPTNWQPYITAMPLI